MQHSGAADGHVSPAVSKDSRASKHKRSSVDAVDQTAGAGARRQPGRPPIARVADESGAAAFVWLAITLVACGFA